MSSEPAAAASLDLTHLRRMTAGNRALELEILQMFAAQAQSLIGQIRDAGGEATPMAVHTIKGAARGVGATAVAAAAEAAERARMPAARAAAIADLSAALSQVHDEIMRLPKDTLNLK